MKNQEHAKDLYLNLLKNTLTFMLWDEPGMPVETLNSARPLIIQAVVNIVTSILRFGRFQILYKPAVTREQRTHGTFWPWLAFTMVGIKRLDNLQYCVETILKENIPGDFIETGVWRGGSCIFMRGILAAYNETSRRVFVADSFQGLPAPDQTNYPQDTGARFHTVNYLAVSQQEVEENFKKFNLLDDQVVFLKGWFKDTLPNAPIQQLSIIRLDGDLYESTMDALSSLYPKLVPGGFCIIDDWSLEPCQKAVKDFRAEHGITEPIEEIDGTGIYWRKASN